MTFPGPIYAKPGSIAYRKEVNSGQVCRVPGCGAHRKGLELFCAAHRSAGRLYGHPSARAISPKEYAGYVEEARSILERNVGSHPWVAPSLTYIRSTLEKAAKGDSVPAARELAWLHANGVTPMQVLSTLAGFHAWAYSRPFPNDRAQGFAVSRAILALAPRPRQQVTTGKTKGTSTSVPPRISALSSLGPRFMKDLGPVVMKVLATIEHSRAAQAAGREQPFI
jgi:hypothetical protein